MFIPWPCQQRFVRGLWAAIDGGYDILSDKSRDMGASWLCLATLVWFFLFQPDTPLLVASRKEEYVDGGGNPDTLFWKIRYLISRCPLWLRPQTDDRHMHLCNLDNGSVIDGESTNGDLGRGGRRKAILLDEFAAVENGREILSATADASPCRIFNSTPKGAGSFDAKGVLRGNAFAAMRFKPGMAVVSLHWREHPTKGAGARLATDPATGIQRWTSPWYESECSRRGSSRDIAENLDIDYLSSGSMFFDSAVIARIRSGDVRDPAAVGELDFSVETIREGGAYRISPPVFKRDHGRRRLQLWCTLPNGRPRQDRNYVAFSDIGMGMGASNSVLKFCDTTTREVVAQLATSDLLPTEFADYSVALCRWFGGAVGYVYLGWEANGPGGEYAIRVRQLGYPYILHVPRDLADPSERDDTAPGWHSTGGTGGSKATLLGQYRAALARGEIIEHDAATVGELEQYVYYASGTPGPSSLVEEAEGARAAHGDRVIAGAGLVLCLAQQPRATPPKPVAPPGSFAAMQRDYRAAKTARSNW